MNDQLVINIIADILSSRKNIYINKISNFFEHIYKELNSSKAEYSLYIEYSDNVNSIQNPKSNISIDENKNKKYDYAILTDTNAIDLFNVLDKLDTDAKCIILGKFKDKSIDINIYKYVHQKRIEIFFINQFEIN